MIDIREILHRVIDSTEYDYDLEQELFEQVKKGQESYITHKESHIKILDKKLEEKYEQLTMLQERINSQMQRLGQLSIVPHRKED